MPINTAAVGGNNSNIGYYYVYDNNSTNPQKAKSIENYNTYGVLYNWGVAQSACPPGWHLPSLSEWNFLFQYITNSTEQNNQSSAGFYEIAPFLKSVNLWNKDDKPEDLFGLGLQPGGFRNSHGDYCDIGNSGIWWTSSESKNEEKTSKSIILETGHKVVHIQNENDWDCGLSIRCIKNK